MIRVAVLSAFLSLIILSCEEKKVAEQAEVPPISIKEIIVTDNDCDTDSISCTYAHVTYPVFSDTSKMVLNEQIVGELVAAGSSYFNEETIKGTPKELAQLFISDYQNFRVDFPDYSLGWFLKLDAQIISESNRMLSFFVYSESFTGGAHPNSATSYFVIDKNLNKALSVTDLIADTVLFKTLLEQAFREEKEMADSESFADRGYYINDGDFLLNDNIGLTDSSVIIHFNSYEIASYAEGPTTLEVPKSELAEMLKLN